MNTPGSSGVASPPSSTMALTKNLLIQLWTRSRIGDASKSVIVALVLMAAVLYNRIANHRDHVLSNGIPGDRGFFPLVDESFSLIRRLRGFYVDRFKRFGPVFRSRIFGYNVIAVADPQLTSFVLCNEDLFAARFFPAAMRMVEGFMLVQGGHEHKRSRSLVLRALTEGQLKRNLKGIASTFHMELDRWKSQPDGVEIYSAMKTAIMKVMMEVLFGNSALTEQEITTFVNDFITYGNGLAAAPIDLPFSPRGKGLAARQRLLDWFVSLIETRRSDSEAVHHHDLLQAMIDSPDPETGLKADTDAIAKNALVVLLAALDTTASVTASALKLMLDHPEVLKKLREESLKVWGTPESITNLEEEELYAKLNSLAYMDCVVQEALRYRSPLLSTMRETTQDVMIPGTDYVIPKGWFVTPVISLPFMSDEKSFPQPKEFRPERFDANGGESAASAGFKGAFTPFGKGAHQCPGWRFAVAETKIVLSILAMQNKWPKHLGDGFSWLGPVDYYAPALEIMGGSRWNFHGV